VDALRVVWHGHYLSYFEDARLAFGDAYDLGYQHLLEAGLVAPVVHVSCDYLKPARFGDRLEVEARLYQRDAARLEFHYRVIRPSDDALLATGHTAQAFMALNGDLLLTQPEFMRAFYARWQDAMCE
jgi:acyl-CoA thioester hydrolase